MRISKCAGCTGFPCTDVRKECYSVPDIEVQPEAIRIVMISEAAAADPADNYYCKGNPLFERTTVQAFNDAGHAVKSMRDILALGIYLTTAVKCAKTEYGLQAKTVEQCSYLLERELACFPNVAAYLLMGDVAIKAVNFIARRNDGIRAIPAGSTYKIRSGTYLFQGKRAFPSYLQAGPSFFIEKSKRRMIAEDIARALTLDAGSRAKK